MVARVLLAVISEWLGHYYSFPADNHLAIFYWSFPAHVVHVLDPGKDISNKVYHISGTIHYF